MHPPLEEVHLKTASKKAYITLFSPQTGKVGQCINIEETNLLTRSFGFLDKDIISSCSFVA
jgi:hypothetical protein